MTLSDSDSDFSPMRPGPILTKSSTSHSAPAATSKKAPSTSGHLIPESNYLKNKWIENDSFFVKILSEIGLQIAHLSISPLPEKQSLLQDLTRYRALFSYFIECHTSFHLGSIPKSDSFPQKRPFEPETHEVAAPPSKRPISTSEETHASTPVKGRGRSNQKPSTPHPVAKKNASLAHSAPTAFPPAPSHTIDTEKLTSMLLTSISKEALLQTPLKDTSFTPASTPATTVKVPSCLSFEAPPPSIPPLEPKKKGPSASEKSKSLPDPSKSSTVNTATSPVAIILPTALPIAESPENPSAPTPSTNATSTASRRVRSKLKKDNRDSPIVIEVSPTNSVAKVETDENKIAISPLSTVSAVTAVSPLSPDVTDTTATTKRGGRTRGSRGARKTVTAGQE